MAIKDMPVDEKYDKLFDFYVLENAMNYAFHEERDTVDKWLDYTVEAYRSYMAPMFEGMKTLTTKQVANQLIHMQQMMQPLSEIEVSWVSDSEAVMRFRNCEILRRSREIVKKSGLGVNSKFYCLMGLCRHTHPRHPIKDFGIDITCELEENGCKWTFKLK